MLVKMRRTSLRVHACSCHDPVLSADGSKLTEWVIRQTTDWRVRSDNAIEPPVQSVCHMSTDQVADS